MATRVPRKILLAFLVAPLLFHACSKAPPEPETRTDRREITARLRAAVEETAGAQVWVKIPSRPGGGGAGAVEVIVASEAFEPALDAFRRESARLGLEILGEMRPGREGLRRADLRLRQRHVMAGRWRWRETLRLRYAALVLDDMGQELAPARRLLALPCPITFAVLPHLPHSRTVAEEAHRAGREVMLHWPMQPQPNGEARPGPGEIRVEMSGEEVERTLEENLSTVPYARGANNHMGSLATADPRLMSHVMRTLARRGLYFVDSRTTGSSVALDEARRNGLPALYRSVFLDGTPTEEYTLGQLRQLVRVVEQQDAALAIGHPYPSTLSALERFLPEFERRDIRLVPVSRLLELPQVERLEPPRAATR